MPKNKLPQNPLVGKDKKLHLPGERRKGKWLGKGVVIGLLAAGALGGGRFLKNRNVRMEQQRHSYEHFVGQEKLARNPRIMSKICMIYHWSPVTPEGLKRISFVDEISRRTGLSEKKVMATIEVNPLTPQRIEALRTKLKSLEGYGSRKMPQEIARVKRVILIVDAAVRIDGGFAELFGAEVMNGSGTKGKISRLNEN